MSDEAYRLKNGASPGDVASQRGSVRVTTSHTQQDELGSIEQAADGAVDDKDHRFSLPLNIYILGDAQLTMRHSQQTLHCCHF